MTRKTNTYIQLLDTHTQALIEQALYIAIEQMGHYDNAEIVELVNDAMHSKVCDLYDTLGYDYMEVLANGTYYTRNDNERVQVWSLEDHFGNVSAFVNEYLEDLYNGIVITKGEALC